MMNRWVGKWVDRWVGGDRWVDEGMVLSAVTSPERCVFLLWDSTKSVFNLRLSPDISGTTTNYRPAHRPI